MFRRLLPAVIAAATLAANAAAQARPAKNALSIQPGAALGIMGVEYERANANTSTFGAGVFRYSRGSAVDEVTFTSTEIRLRYYPAGVALQGFLLGGAIGLSNVKGTSRSLIDQSQTAPSIGLMLEYQQLLGQKRGLSLALGVGARAVFVGKDEITSPEFRARHPTARVSVGWAW